MKLFLFDVKDGDDCVITKLTVAGIRIFVVNADNVVFYFHNFTFNVEAHAYLMRI